VIPLIELFDVDFRNSFFYGGKSPKFAELIWVNSVDVRRYISPLNCIDFFKRKPRRMSGRVVRDWPIATDVINDNAAVDYCLRHWRGGLSWSDSGAIDFMMRSIEKSEGRVSDGCRNIEDIHRRFKNLDDAWAVVNRDGRLMTRQEMYPSTFRELGGVLIHLGPGGEPFFSGAGCHRFAMAVARQLVFPAQLGCVHVSALKALEQLRKNENQLHSIADTQD
jgi:hypothetical protein